MAIRSIKKREDELSMSRMAEALMKEGGTRNFWQEVKKLQGPKKLPPHLDGATDSCDIADIFSQKCI